MNVSRHEKLRTIGTALICFGAGAYLLTLEVVRVANHVRPEFSFLWMSVFGLVCLVSALLIPLGGVLRIHSREQRKLALLLVFSVAGFLLLAPALLYLLPYFIPYVTGESYGFVDSCVLVIIVGAAFLSLGFSASLALRL